MRRTLAASLVPAAAIVFAWLTTEQPPLWGAAGVVAAIALATALPRRWWQRAIALVLAAAAVIMVAAGARPSASLRKDDLFEPVLRSLSNGIGDFYGVVLPFDPARHADMHSVVTLAVFGFVAASAQLVAARRPLGAAAVTIVGVGWPATLTESDAVLLGALALGAVLSLLIALGVRSARGAAVSVTAASAVVAVAAGISATTSISQSPALDWRSWDFRGVPASALGVRFVWNANYDGISFPPTRTVVMEVEGPESGQYWRVSTLDLFTADRWFEELYPQQIGPAEGDIPLDSLMPPQARDRSRWMEQRVEVKALVDDRVAAAGTPVAISAGSLGTVFHLTGGVIRARRTIPSGTRYRVWSYAPDPTPNDLAAAPTVYPGAARRFLVVWGRVLPPFEAAGREEVVRDVLANPTFALSEYEPLYDEAVRVTRDSRTPYAAVLALESWFRRSGGFTYEERPARLSALPPLVEFVTASKEGYCQHYAGAMAVMLRLLGVPARVAVGFTSGRRAGKVWSVSDHDAHAWVEAWFPGQGWVAFDPTPGRGTLSGVYSFASENAQAVAALGRGDLDAVDAVGATQGRGVTGRRGAFEPSSGGDRRPTLLGLLALLGIAGAGALGLTKAVARRARYVSRDPRAVATASRRELEGFLRDQGIAVAPGATLDDLGAAVTDEIGPDGHAFSEAAGRARFGPPDDARRSAQAARRELRALLRAARGELSAWRRLRGFVSVRSLGGGWSE
ncbi:MAG: transglutaminaseTgpA domain-containing protein [Gaiellaceae bacterium]